jgi:guanylate kinase
MTYNKLSVSGPSGSGKTTIRKRIIELHSSTFDFSVSATTRPLRKNEVDGVDYFSCTPVYFQELILKGAFVEYEEVYPGRFYGTLKSEVHRIETELGKKPLFDVDVQGGKRLKVVFGQRILSVAIVPKTIDLLIKHLKMRDADMSSMELGNRIIKAESEIAEAKNFDLVIVNTYQQEDLDRMIQSILEEFLLMVG